MPRRYRWDEWFSLRRFVLAREVHYWCSQKAIKQQIRDAACAREIGVHLVDEGDRVLVEVRPVRRMSNCGK